MKTKTSNRTLPLIPEMRLLLEERRERIERDKEYFGSGYISDYYGFVCVDKQGRILMPNNLTRIFRVFLKRKGLKHIRLHDLRHSCASLMLANGIQMKQIQEWLGHADFGTTANTYSHLDFSSKIQSAKTIAGILDFEEKRKESKEDIINEIERLREKLRKIG